MKNENSGRRSKRRIIEIGWVLTIIIGLGVAQPAWARIPAPESPEPPLRGSRVQQTDNQAPSPELPHKVFLSAVYSNYLQVAIPAEITPDPRIQTVIDQVTPGGLESIVADLSGVKTPIIAGAPYTLTTRYSHSGQPIEMATTYAYERFEALGLAPQYHSYQTDYGTWRNVIAEQKGRAYPEDIFMIVAHLDSTVINPQLSKTVAPGADDNASGSAAVLTAANLLSQYSFDCTLRYAVFTGEEQGLYGSQAYARDAHSQNERIRGVINLDMIAYNRDGLPIIDLHTRPGQAEDQQLAELMAEVVEDYHLTLTPEIFQDGMRYSDHASFWDFDFPAILAIEDDDDFNAYYHSPMDTIDKLDLNYYAEFVKAAVGAAAHIACPNSATFEK